MNVYEKMLVEFFGTTEDIKEAGYVLKDGTLIDLSGRHFISDPIERKYHIGSNGIQHHDIFGTNYRGFSIEDIWFDMCRKEFQPVASILNHTQCISLKMDTARHVRECWIRMMYPPTEAQYSVIFKNFEEGRANVSYLSPDGYIVDDITIPFLTPSKLYSFVESCANKPPTGILFSTASYFGRDVVCSPLDDTYIPMFNLSENKEFRLRQKVYQDPNHLRDQKASKRKD